MAEHTATSKLGELYAMHAPDAQRIAYLLTGSRHQAEDLVQDAFVRVAGRFADLRDPEAFGVYLKRTVVNLANSWFRRRALEREHLQREGRGLRQESHDHDTGARDEMWRTLLLLQPRQRAAIVLRFYEDMTEEQIAMVLRCARGTVKSLISRGLETMRERIEGE